jgi:hypothetical protein
LAQCEQDHGRRRQGTLNRQCVIVLGAEADIRRYLEPSAEGNGERALEALRESVEHVKATRRPTEARFV